MNIEILHQESYPLAQITLAAQESFRAVGGTLVGMDTSVQLNIRPRESVLRSAGTASTPIDFYEYRAMIKQGNVLLASPLPGDIVINELGVGNSEMLIRPESFWGADTRIRMRVEWRAAQRHSLNEGIRFVSLTGVGAFLLALYGATHEVELQAGASMLVSPGHLVGMTPSVTLTRRTISGKINLPHVVTTTMLEVDGPGKIIMQTHSARALSEWVRDEVR